MNHQTYEEWALMPESLSPEEHQSLKQHLKACESCRKLAANWAKAESLLQEAVLASPAPGFTQRFTASLAARKAKEHRRQVRKFLVILGIILLVAMTTVSIFYYTTNSPIAVIENLFKTGAQLVTIWENIKAVSGSITRIAPAAIFLPVLIIGGIILAGMTSVWLATIWKFTLAGGKVR